MSYDLSRIISHPVLCTMYMYIYYDIRINKYIILWRMRYQMWRCQLRVSTSSVGIKRFACYLISLGPTTAYVTALDNDILTDYKFNKKLMEIIKYTYSTLAFGKQNKYWPRQLIKPRSFNSRHQKLNVSFVEFPPDSTWQEIMPHFTDEKKETTLEN